MPRISKENYYLDIAETVLERATCLRRVYGAVVTDDDDFHRLQRRAPQAEARRSRLLHTRGAAGPARRALRALPQRPR